MEFRYKLASFSDKFAKQTNDHFFLPKKNTVFWSPILQNLNRKSVLDNFFLENNPLEEPKKMLSSKKFYLFRKMVKNAKW